MHYAFDYDFWMKLWFVAEARPHMLRRRMGDERFLSFLGELRRRFEWKSVDTEGFRMLAAGFLPPKSADPVT